MESDNAAAIKPKSKIDPGIILAHFQAMTEEVKRKELHHLRVRNFRLTRQVGLAYENMNNPYIILLELIRWFKETQHRLA